MKITKEQLKQIIKEELEDIHTPSYVASNQKLYDYLTAKLGEKLATELVAAVELTAPDVQEYIAGLADEMIVAENKQ
jgi:hypothetical protein